MLNISLTPQEVDFLKKVISGLSVNPLDAGAPIIVSVVQSVGQKLSAQQVDPAAANDEKPKTEAPANDTDKPKTDVLPKKLKNKVAKK